MTPELKEEFNGYMEVLSALPDNLDFSEYLSEFRLADCLQDNPQKKTFLLERSDGSRLICKYACGEYLPMLKTESEISHLKKFPFLPYVIDYRENEKGAFLLREYIEGDTLDELIRERGPLPLEEACAITRRLCRCLSLFHRMSPPLIYRDVKPSNIILTPDGDCYFIDMGTVRRYQESESADTICMGTASFAAPEQFGARQSDARTDIYGIGVLFYFLLTGESKLDDDRLATLPAKVSLLIRKCTEFNPDKRCRDVETLMQELDLLSDVKKRRQKKTRFTRPAAIASLAVFLLVLLVLFSDSVYRQIKQRRPVVFSSAMLEQAVREELKKTNGEPVLPEDLKRITSLKICGNSVIRNQNDHQIYMNPHGVCNVLQEESGDIHDISLLAQMPNLHVLILDYQQISDISPLKGLELTSLSLTGNPLSDLSALSGCTSLYTLDVSSTSVYSLDALSDCKSLHSLNCSYCPVRELAPLSKINLTELYINDVPAQDYEALESSQLILLKCSNIPSAALEHIRKMDFLQALYVWNCDIPSLKVFEDGFPALNRLYISYCGLQSLADIECLSSLSDFDISGNPVSDGKPLTKLQGLQYLNVCNTGISDFSFLNDMPCLNNINISKIQLPYLEKAVPKPWFTLPETYY